MGLTISLKKQPHKQQQIFIDQACKEQLFGGAKRGGKSVSICQKSVLLNVMFPGNRGLLARYNYTDLADTTLTEFFEVCPSELILSHHKGDKQIILRTVNDRSTQKSSGTKDGFSPYASRQLYRGLGDEEDFEKVKGLSLGHFAIDEPSEVPLEQYLMILAQLDWTLPDGGRPPYMGMLSSNPEPGWVEDRFPITRPYEEVDGKIFIPSLPMDNPHLPPGFVDYLIANFPKEWVEKYVRGVWGASEGAIFKEFDEVIHNLDNWIEYNDPVTWAKFHWPLNLVMAIDHADTGYVAMVLAGIDIFGNVFILDEYYEKNKVVSEHCFSMNEKLQPYLSLSTGGGASLRKDIQYRLIDPAAFYRTQQRGQILQGVAEDYRANGFPAIPAWNAIEHGFNMMAEHFHPISLHRHPFTGHMLSPSMFVSKYRCPNTWKQIRGIKKKITASGKVEYQGVDHALDCVRYIILSRPRRPELAHIDEMNLGSAHLMAKRTHDQWVRKFSGQMDSGMFSGMGFK